MEESTCLPKLGRVLSVLCPLLELCLIDPHETFKNFLGGNNKSCLFEGFQKADIGLSLRFA